jgi:porphobilinogen synthase
MKEFSRKMVSENNLFVDDLIQPLFVTRGKLENSNIASMPGIKRYSIDSIVNEAREIYDLGIPAIALFPYIENEIKDEKGTEALNSNNIICQAIKAIKKNIPELGIICDVALDPYTNHGHDGIINNGQVDNDSTLDILCNQAVNQVKAGCDVIAPSDMMDGRVKSIRSSLDKHNFINTPILSYSAKYASSFYGPFRDALGSKIDKNKIDGKQTYQMDPANSREALREIELDINEGADMIMIKPAISYLDIIKSASNTFNIPIFAYQVSGEYSMIKAASEKGWINEKNIVYETLISIKRSGASCILTYFAKDIAKSMNVIKKK